MAEERRLMYVGATRAEEKLYLSCAGSRTIFGRTGYNAPSRFLNEIDDAVLEQVSKAGNRSEAGSLPFSARRYDRATTARSLGPVQTPTSQTSRLTSTGGDQLDWKAGDKATHGKWGTGMVVSVKGEGDGMELDIAFPQPIGIKRLLAKFAPITKA
jgi:DNA helicase-2/ATP-dependent DNA helicase PcrA